MIKEPNWLSLLILGLNYMGQSPRARGISPLVLALLLGAFIAALPKLAVTAPAKSLPKLVVSNKPLALVVKAIVADTMAVTVLIPQNADPHHFQLKPSDMLQVQRSDLLIWLSPEIEPNLAKLMVTKSVSDRFGIDENLDLNLLPLRDSGLVETSGHGHSHPHGEGHLEGLRDLHVWTSPSRMLKFAQGLATSLQQRYPEYNAQLNTNLERFEKAVRTELSKSALGFDALDFSSVVLYHDAFQYFENDYGISTAGYLLEDLEQKLSLRQMLKAKLKLADKEIQCVIVEPGYNPKLLQKVFGKRYFDTVSVSPLAEEIELTKTAYVEFIKGIAEGMKSCAQ